jgi:hypothetical protein
MMQWIESITDLFPWARRADPGELYALFSSRGQPLTLNPATDLFIECSIKELKTWDVQSYDDPRTWFMGNNPQPKIQYIIRALTAKEKATFRKSKKTKA